MLYAVLYISFKERIDSFALRERELCMMNRQLQEELSVANHWRSVQSDIIRQSHANNESLEARLTEYNHVVDELDEKLEVNGNLLDSKNITIKDLETELENAKLLIKVNRDMVAERDVELHKAYVDLHNVKMRLRFYEPCA